MPQTNKQMSELDKFKQWACFNTEANLTGKQARLVWDYFKDNMAKSNECWNQKLSQSIAKAREEERERIIKKLKEVSYFEADSIDRNGYKTQSTIVGRGAYQLIYKSQIDELIISLKERNSR